MEKKYLELAPGELEKINKARARSEGTKIDEEQLFIAEFGKHFGWGGVMAILNNEIDGETAVWLLQGARKVDFRYMLNNAQASLIGSASAQSKKPSATFKSTTKEIVKAMKADI